MSARLLSMARGRGVAPASWPASIAVAAALSLPALVAQWLPGWAEALEYRREVLTAGEWWRWVTCHWAHWSIDHLVWDLGVFALLAALCWQRGRRRALAAVASSALAVPAAVWLLLPAMSHYRGLSGIDSALYVLFALLEMRAARGEGRRAVFWLFAGLLAALGAKVGFELATADTLFVDRSASSFVPVPLAHLVGGLCGALASRARDGARSRATHQGSSASP